MLNQRKFYFLFFFVILLVLTLNLARIEAEALAYSPLTASAVNSPSTTWRKVSEDGFGTPDNQAIISLLSHYWGYLYAGTGNWGYTGGHLWRMDLEGTWEPITLDGFGNPNNHSMMDLHLFNGTIYAATHNSAEGAEIWRSLNGDPDSWEKVVSQGFGVPENHQVTQLYEYNNYLYAGTFNVTTGGQVWRSNSGDAGSWEPVVTGGFGDVNNQYIISFGQFGGYLYAGTYNWVTGGEIWRTPDGVSWTQVNEDGFDAPNFIGISSLFGFNGYLYANVRAEENDVGVQIWRCFVCDSSASWEKVVDNGFGNPNTSLFGGFARMDNALYLVVGNDVTGMEVWRTINGTEWKQVGFGGFDSPDNSRPWRQNNLTEFNGSLYSGTRNLVTGGQIWQYLDQQAYLPFMAR